MDQRLSELVEDLTTSGEPQLNAEKMKELKKICKSSEEQLSRAYHLLMARLSQEHAEVRLSAFQVVGELFGRSHLFRVLVVSNFQEFLELTLGTDHRKPLPPPREVARRLKQAVTLAVQSWNEKFGAAYKKLALGYHFLKHGQQVDFQDVDARTPAERKREEERQRRLDHIYRQRSEQAVREMQEMSEEIRGCLVEADSCFRLLLPFDLGPCPGAAPPATARPTGTADPGDDPGDGEQPCCSKTLPDCARPTGAPSGAGPRQACTGAPSEDEEEEDDSDDGDPDEFLRHHGLGSHKYTLDVELRSDGLRVRADEDNCAVIQSAQDALKLIRNKFLPAVCSWVQLFTRAGTHRGHLEAAIGLKAELEAALRRSRELDIEPAGLPGREVAAPEDEDEDDDDFVEVPEKEGYEACVPEHLWPKGGLETDPAAQDLQARKRARLDEEASDPTSAAAQPHWLRGPASPAPCPSPRAPLGPEEAGKLAAERARAPILPFGVDLCNWGQEPPAAGKVVKAESQHRFWKPSEVDEEVTSAEVSEGLRSRRITFAGRFEPVQHRCRAPKPNGQLCERQDRLKCPFHGKIVPRDDAGRPLCPEDRAREQRQQLQRQAQRPDWRDPELTRDVEAALGVDLGSSGPRGRGRGRRRGRPGLTDLKQQADTARTRIAKKVFAKAAVRRVSAALDQMDQRKHRKFANQFNYALS
ncbi:UV-stimulated scaffold protein A isoform X1 [Phyllostomus hastatus]|uniref:UV-stimulated scaffold protein A isoform X1 n=1 Tax=Phyllostomus hastatus TaxID=9423 RepID=UPI001E681C7E|nr:UV-stimulated scaffold protein A isoform X1 [Phyllostomus hastatus]XP_045690241.1 UV-stimulated scaffold protein A isoform X1 [Phyllostomus hastatus]